MYYLGLFNVSPFNYIDSQIGVSLLCECVTTCGIDNSSVYCAVCECNGYAACSMRTDQPDMVYIAAYNSTESEKASADYICSGTFDEITIMQAHNENKHIENLTFLFSSGTFNFSRTIELKNVNIVGQGPYSTIFEFILRGTNPKNIYDTSIGLILKTTGTTTIDGISITANGTLKLIYDDSYALSDASRVNRFEVSNVRATNYRHNSRTYCRNGTLGKIMVEIAYPVQTVQPTFIPNATIEFSNCIVDSTDYSGFVVYGDMNNDVLARAMKDIYFKNCKASTCGINETRSVIAGFHMLINVTAENIRFQNCIASDNWHSGFFFDDARMRKYTAMERADYASNIVYNLYMDNCYAYDNGKRSRGRVAIDMLPFCSGFVLREYGMRDDSIESVPQFYSYNIDGTSTFTPVAYPSYLGDARGPHEASDQTKVAYGNIVNCIASGNTYADYYCRGNNWNTAELSLLNCRASDSRRSLVVNKHEGLRIVNFVSDGIISPAVTLININSIIVDRMKIMNTRQSQTLSFTDMDGYNLLPVLALQVMEVDE